MMKSLVTGCNGFVGTYLCNYLQKTGNEVFGIDLQDSPSDDSIVYRKLDITEYDSLVKVLHSWQVDVIYHLAAIANPRIAQQDPLQAIRINTLGTANFAEYCRKHSGVSLLVVGSSEAYKMKDSEEIVFTEGDAIESRNIYGASKIAAEILSKEYSHLFETPIFFSRSFNHTGPGQLPHYVLSNFAKQCAEISRDKRRDAEIYVGNIDLYRDFLDVRDVVKAYEAIVTKGIPGEVYNVCSGTAYHIRGLLEFLISLTKVSDVQIVSDPLRIRRKEVLSISGNPEKLFQTTGWIPAYSIQDTLRDLFDYWLTNA